MAYDNSQGPGAGGEQPVRSSAGIGERIGTGFVNAVSTGMGSAFVGAIGGAVAGAVLGGVASNALTPDAVKGMVDAGHISETTGTALREMSGANLALQGASGGAIAGGVAGAVGGIVTGAAKGALWTDRIKQERQIAALVNLQNSVG